ncbi:Dbp6p [Sugiyamaella lignohabitans]|uniref:ATP-dependent RNA helicase n=1 Tax=Sugiyamaella lignohabitans TaxID=796027 RepID=A0A161HIR3_9ASCO|nr:Dbp6p [Sugiyamaella lignohabitans]ANB11108.1 Dbp6p [Sugiyamaella lignohabitans]
MFLATKRFDPNFTSQREEDDQPEPKKVKLDKELIKKDVVPSSLSSENNPAKSNTPIETNSLDSSHVSSSKSVLEESDDSESEYEVDPKYSAVFKRFQDIASKAAKNNVRTSRLADQEAISKDSENNQEEPDEEEIPEVNELVPLPQIARKKESSKKHKEPPKWITEPIIIPLNASKPFAEYEKEHLLSARMVKVLQSLNYESAFAVQTGVCPVLLKDSQSIAPDPLPDVLVNAYTGSGKTLAYGIPIVEALSKRVVPRIRALILLPTRPLIQQVRNVLESLAKGTSLRVMICRTDRPFKEEQALISSHTPDILITTPGRLVDHIRNNTQGFSLNHLQYLVVDEADRLLNQSFQEWVSVLVNALEAAKPKESLAKVWNRPPQKLIFSATLTRDPGKLAALNITTTPTPRIFVLGEEPVVNNGHTNTTSGPSVHEDRQRIMMDYEFSLPEKLQEHHIQVKSASNKPLVLLQLLINHSLHSDTLIFVKSNQAAARLARLIQLIDEELFHLNLSVERCSGELELSQRRKMLKKFADGEIGILVCTDLIARGIDIASVKAVINYDLPVGKREYVHRVGRTARAGNSGAAWNLTVGSGERKFFNSITTSIFRTGEIESEVIKPSPDHNDGYQKALSRLEQEVFAK